MNKRNFITKYKGFYIYVFYRLALIVRQISTGNKDMFIQSCSNGINDNENRWINAVFSLDMNNLFLCILPLSVYCKSKSRKLGNIWSFKVG